ncbi:hypothetical protein BG015_002031, partial [Linnemannia schmuckeri]
MSYLHRAVSTSWFYVWFLFYVSRWDRFEAFRLRRLQRFELRSVVTVLVIFSLGLQLVYDIGSARLKYLEGFWTNPKTHEIQSKPAQAWTEENMLHVEPLYYTLACSLSLQNCAFFLLQAFWSYISKSVTKSSFMSSFEFKVYLVASCGAVVLFPTVQYLFRNDFVYREVVPHLIFCILLFTTGALGLRVHFRLVALIKNASITMNESTLSVLEKLEYFKDMNVILTFSVFACSFSLGIVAVDGITPHPTIAGNKFASDLLITNLNFFQVIIWVTLTLIFYPRKSVVTASLGSHNNTSGNNNYNNNNNNNNNSSGRHDIIINNKRGPSDRFRLARRNNEVLSEDNNIQNHSKAQLVAAAENEEVLDPYWARDDSRQEQDYQQEYQLQQQQRRQHGHGHLRAFSHDSRNDTAVTLMPLSPPPPSLTIVTSSAGLPTVAKMVTSPTSPPPRGSPTSPTGRVEMETRTLYYHEALAKAQQQQQQEQANEYYNMISVSAPDSEYNENNLPQRTFSQGSHYKTNSGSSSSNNTNNTSNRNSGGASRPERSSHRPAPSAAHKTTHGRSTPTADMYHHHQQYQHQHRAVSPAGRNTPTVVDQYRPTTRVGAVSPPPGGRSASSMDFRPPRDYPSITQTTAAAASHATKAQNSDSPHELQRMRSASSSHRNNNNNNRPLSPATAHQEMEMMMMTDPRIIDPRTVSALGQHAPTHLYQHRRQDSSESDLSVIQIAYVGNTSQATTATPEQGQVQGGGGGGEGGHHDEEFYD